MFKLRIQSNFVKSLLLCLLTIFVVSKSLTLFHVFSHHNLATEIAQDFKSGKSSHGKVDSCFLCSFSNLQNHLTLAPALLFVLIAFYLGCVWRRCDRVKLSYLLASRAARAPPVIS